MFLLEVLARAFHFQVKFTSKQKPPGLERQILFGNFQPFDLRRLFILSWFLQSSKTYTTLGFLLILNPFSMWWPGSCDFLFLQVWVQLNLAWHISVSWAFTMARDAPDAQPIGGGESLFQGVSGQLHVLFWFWCCFGDIPWPLFWVCLTLPACQGFRFLAEGVSSAIVPATPICFEPPLDYMIVTQPPHFDRIVTSLPRKACQWVDSQ